MCDLAVDLDDFGGTNQFTAELEGFAPLASKAC